MARGASISGVFQVPCGCVDRRPSGTPLSVEGRFSTVALDVHLQDRGVMNEPIDGGEGHRMVGEDASPFAERLVCRYEH